MSELKIGFCVFSFFLTTVDTKTIGPIVKIRFLDRFDLFYFFFIFPVLTACNRLPFLMDQQLYEDLKRALMPLPPTILDDLFYHVFRDPENMNMRHETDVHKKLRKIAELVDNTTAMVELVKYCRTVSAKVPEKIFEKHPYLRPSQQVSKPQIQQQVPDPKVQQDIALRKGMIVFF